MLGALNLLVRPILLALIAPVSVALLGVATLVWQVVAIVLVAWLLSGITVDTWITAFIGSWVYAILNTALTAILSIDQDESYWGALAGRSRPAGAT